MAPRRLRIVAGLGWLLVCISAIGWNARTDDAARWIGVDRGLQARVRLWMADRILPPAPTVHPVDASLTVGRWTPQGSRRHRLLELLGLSQPPAQLAPDFDSARAAIAQRARAQLAALDTGDRLALLAELQGTRWRHEREDWLIDAAVIPGVCPWLDDADFVAQLDANDAALVEAMQCDTLHAP